MNTAHRRLLPLALVLAGWLGVACLAVNTAAATGTAIECLDLRSGSPFAFQAARVLQTGARDSAWVPDSSRLCLGSVEGIEFERVGDESGGGFVAWADTRLALANIYLQHFGADGTVAEGWPDGGVAICSAPNTQHHLGMCADGTGGVFVAWEDFRNGASDIYATHILGNGGHADGWSTDGDPICLASGGQSRPTVGRSPDGVFIAWEDRRLGVSSIYCTRRNGDGSTPSGWHEQGDLLAIATPAFDPVVATDSSGHCALLWRQEGTAAAWLRCAALEEASPILGAAAMTLSQDVQSVSAPALTRFGPHGLLVAWNEHGASGSSARLQKLDLDAGVTAGWSSPAVLHRGALGIRPPSAVVMADGSVIGAWEDFDNDLDGDISLARVLSDGTIDTLWSSDGSAALRAAGSQYAPHIARDGASAVLVTWSEATTGGAAGYLASRIEQEGLRPSLLTAMANPGHVHIVWQANRAFLASFEVERRAGDDEWKSLGSVAPDKAGRLIVDDRTVAEGARLTYRLLYRDSLGTIYLPPVNVSVPVAPVVLALSAVVPRARTHQLLVIFSLPHGPAPELDLIDVLGRRSGREQLTGLDPGEHRFVWNVRSSLASGVYFLRLTQGNTTRVAKLVYVR